jgi:hypothetical protein
MWRIFESRYCQPLVLGGEGAEPDTHVQIGVENRDSH